MNLVEYFIKNRVVTLVATALLVFLGIKAYNEMSRLEDPEFTIKEALVVTQYPGASAIEVEQEVTDEIELAVQKLGQLDSIESRSERGLSTVTVTIQDKYDGSTLPQVWDELRRKVGDAQALLPPGAHPSIVIDDYGDVYGVFLVIYGNEYTYAELKEVVDLMKRELLLVQDVAKIDTLGESPEAIYVEINRERLAELDIPVSLVINELQKKNLVQDSGRVQVGTEFVTINPTGEVNSIEDFEDIRITVGDKQISLSDLANVRRGYVEPQSGIIRYNGHKGIALGISTRSGGNVVTMGEALEARLYELASEIPVGIEAGLVSVQSTAVVKAIDNFVISLIEAVAIVVVVLLLFMGLRSGLLIGFILVVTILGSFIFLHPMGVALERISLGALIIALGMLVDNAIVVVDGMLVRIEKGQDASKAAVEVVGKTAIPLLGATAIAVLAFAAIGTSQDQTGEFCRSLYQVILVSLTLSWVTAVTITPLLGILFLKPSKKKSGDGNGSKPGGVILLYQKLLGTCLRNRWLTIPAVLGVFVVAIWGFGNVKSSFFPPSTRPQFMIDLWMPQGTHIDETAEKAYLLEEMLMADESVRNVTTMVGKGALRFLLTYTPEKPNSAYAHFLVDADAKDIDRLIRKVDTEFSSHFANAQIYGYKFELGPGSKGKVEPRFYGEDPDVLRDLSAQALAIIRDDPDSKAIITNWRDRVKVARPQVLEEQASLFGVTKADIATVLRQGFQGWTIGVYREEDLLLPIILKAEAPDNAEIANIGNLQIWSPAAQQSLPLRQMISGVTVEFEDEIIYRRDRKRSISVFADSVSGLSNDLLERLRPQIEAIEMPEGYSLEWGGEFEDSAKAKGSLAGTLPTFIGAMIVMTILLFNSLRDPLVIWLSVPLIIIGVAAGLLLFDEPFNFMAILGFLSLIGMLIKNAIVLIDEFRDLSGDTGCTMQILLEGGASRLRPVAMAAATTALGMIPLFFDAFFVAMAITIIFGLMVATVLTMVVLPVIYAIVFKVPND
ncbi:efflux RND transporter permease subunit [Pelagicoccus mobilis]|uniref:Efflux RND transporter permease subunit n=1 Tax=Pelagicoccus mobilis TaxID=415221 RepID=A0A934VRK8_9BACT|nr:efflux RND transporter permease subunit [Pelagicoccus mobilis]MBK1877609.1 efflux RND transporter permease subunit [Pelagicoccus mobilis]